MRLRHHTQQDGILKVNKKNRMCEIVLKLENAHKSFMFVIMDRTETVWLWDKTKILHLFPSFLIDTLLSKNQSMFCCSSNRFKIKTNTIFEQFDIWYIWSIPSALLIIARFKNTSDYTWNIFLCIFVYIRSRRHMHITNAASRAPSIPFTYTERLLLFVCLLIYAFLL